MLSIIVGIFLVCVANDNMTFHASLCISGLSSVNRQIILGNKVFKFASISVPTEGVKFCKIYKERSACALSVPKISCARILDNRL